LKEKKNFSCGGLQPCEFLVLPFRLELIRLAA
jgi:hypothetical protein